MTKGSTLVLKGAVLGLGLLVLSVCILGLPRLIASELTGDFDYGWIFIGMYVTAVPFFYALYQALKLLTYIERNMAFSKSSVDAFSKIKYSAALVGALYAAGMPYIFYVADRDDAPGVVAVGFVIIFASFILATAAGVLQSLVQNAVSIKLENDLTV